MRLGSEGCWDDEMGTVRRGFDMFECIAWCFVLGNILRRHIRPSGMTSMISSTHFRSHCMPLRGKKHNEKSEY